MDHEPRIVQVADHSVAIGAGAQTTKPGEVLFRTAAGASLDLHVSGEIYVNGIRVGVDRDLYSDFHWQFGIPFEPGARSSNPFRWETRRDEQADRLREIVMVKGTEDVILVIPSQMFSDLRGVEPGSIILRNIVGTWIHILASGSVILGGVVAKDEHVSPGSVRDNARILQWLRYLMLMDERSM
jgi:hypothetical protein